MSQIGKLPQVGVKNEKYLSCHHLVIVAHFDDDCNDKPLLERWCLKNQPTNMVAGWTSRVYIKYANSCSLRPFFEVGHFKQSIVEVNMTFLS